MKSFIVSTVIGFALTLTLLTQLPERRPAQESTEAPIETVVPEGATTPTPATETVATAPVETPLQPTTPAPEVRTPVAPTNASYSMADFEKVYATFYANEARLSQEMGVAGMQLNQYMAMRARLAPQDQMNMLHPVNQAIRSLELAARQKQALRSQNAFGAFMEMSTVLAAIRVGLPQTDLNRAKELMMYVTRHSFNLDWTTDAFANQTAPMTTPSLTPPAASALVTDPMMYGPQLPSQHTQMVELPSTQTPSAPLPATTAI